MDLKEIIVQDARLAIADFFLVEGSFGIRGVTQNVTLADGTVVNVDLLGIGAIGVNAQIGQDGLSGGNLLSLSGVEFGLAIMSPTADESAAPGLSWTVLQATAESIGSEVSAGDFGCIENGTISKL